ncbi:sigma-70 family RNA polymerase sigma factor [Legionella fallonii]|uniref:RNA polymerase sigma-H factor n=1 Tax=Legionella fallonii LLAP-10 TaxID=1212491 RepID=A0A098G4W8_9GAMM|nr:sigma-70 family RNA polymerase sigma factor [Legionella fallonii]CEG57039.1 RNA polymerase sigma-H factor [Legionella fallonii LLAP-10]
MDIQASYSDDQLVRLAQNGNSKAYNILLGRYHHKIQQIIYFYIHEQASVNDLSQEVLLKVYRYLDYFKEESSFSTWLYKITQNTIKNYFRAVNLRSDSEKQYVHQQYNSIGNSPEHALINIEFGEQIESAISRLSEELRICYGMYLFEGYSYEDIAKKMHCPIGTVRSRIFRARKLLIGYIEHSK